MLGVDPEIGTSALRLWAAAGSAALLAALCVLALVMPRTPVGALVRAAGVVVAAVLGAAATWAFVAAGDQGAERHALETRVHDLSARSYAPGSALACLDGLAGDPIAAACEREIFGSAADVATAISYTTARLALFSELAAYSGRGARLDAELLALHRGLEADRFGFVAYVLAKRDGCTSRNCKGLALLNDASRVRANLSDATLDHYVEHYLPIWAKAAEAPVAEVAPTQPSAAAQADAPGPRKSPVNIDFPTASSIPPVSIMNPEPKGPVLPGVAAAAAANPNPPAAASAAPRRARKQAANPPPQSPAPPVAPGAASAVEPIWPEPVPLQPQTAASPARAATPEASAGAATRAQ